MSACSSVPSRSDNELTRYNSDSIDSLPRVDPKSIQNSKFNIQHSPSHASLSSKISESREPTPSSGKDTPILQHLVQQFGEGALGMDGTLKMGNIRYLLSMKDGIAVGNQFRFHEINQNSNENNEILQNSE